jgi:lysophospholipase L1-like esterase
MGLAAKTDGNANALPAIAEKRGGRWRPAVSSSSSLLIGMATLSPRTTVIVAAVCVVLAWTISHHVRAEETAVKIVVLGDSLTAGYGVPAVDAFPARLEHALRTSGRSVVVANAGVSGDTASMGLRD